MSITRFLYGRVVLCFCSVILATQAFAWEFTLSSTSVFEYDFYNQRATNGFFGKPNTDNGAATGGDFAPTNGWLGMLVDNLVSGSNASRSYFSTSLYPEIKVNPAIKLVGRFG